VDLFLEAIVVGLVRHVWCKLQQSGRRGMERHTRQLPPCARAIILYPSDRSPPTLLVRELMDGPEIDTQESWSHVYHACALSPLRDTPVIVSEIPWGATLHKLLFGGVDWVSWPGASVYGAESATNAGTSFSCFPCSLQAK
jgi:hypothetical protein